MSEPQPDAQVRIDVLGPLRLTVDGRPVDVPGPRRQAVLAMLAMAEGRVVSTDALLAAVWPGEPPESGRRALHSHVSRLRRHLRPAGARLERAGTGYRLALGDDELDVSRVRRIASPGQPRDVDELAGALALWRGVALAEFADVAPLAADAAALAEVRAGLTDDWLAARLDAAVAAGCPADPGLVADAARAAADTPLRERTHSLLVRVLLAAGRQADALRAAHDFRARLADQTGLDPGSDLTEAEQLAAVGAPSPTPGTPPAEPRHASVPRPRPASPLVGREHELRDLRRRVDAERLVTLVGAGGVGKTRLALEVTADASEDGRPVTVVELAAVTDARHVGAAVAAALGLRSQTDEETWAAARDALAAGAPVVLLDNCEHVLAPVRTFVAALVDACPGLSLLATSREPLGLAAEHLVRLGPLAVPEQGARSTHDVPAVEAFLAHARRHQPDLVLAGDESALVADIVRRLDGLPLALELAAGRIGALSLADLHARLDRALDLFEAGRSEPDARHRTLRDTIAWSYRSLAADEARLLGALAVFPGGVDLATAEWLAADLGVAGDPAAVVARLVEASMVTVRRAPAPHGEVTRYRPLETVRAFALDHLDASGDRPAADAALVRWATELAAAIERQAAGPDEALADARLRGELPNLRAAWDLAGARGDVDARAELVVRLDDVLVYRGLLDLSTWALELADDPALDGHPRRIEVLGSAADSAWLGGDLDRSVELADRAIAEATTPDQARRAHEALGSTALFRGDPIVATDRWEEAAAMGTDVAARALGPAALGALYGGDEDRARALLDRAMAVTADHGAPSHRAFAVYAAAEMAAGADPDAAIDLYGQAIALARSVGATFVEGVASVGLVRLWGASGRRRQALEGYRTLLAAWRRSGNWTQVWTTMRNLAGLLAEAGQSEAAVTLLAAAAAAPEAPDVQVDVVAAELAALEAGLADALGPDRVARLRVIAVTLGRSQVVDRALEAVEAALG